MVHNISISASSLTWTPGHTLLFLFYWKRSSAAAVIVITITNFIRFQSDLNYKAREGKDWTSSLISHYLGCDSHCQQQRNSLKQRQLGATILQIMRLRGHRNVSSQQVWNKRIKYQTKSNLDDLVDIQSVHCDNRLNIEVKIWDFQCFKIWRRKQNIKNLIWEW